MAIKEYTKDGKVFFRIVNHYIGTFEHTGKEKRINKMGFKSEREANIYIAKALTEFETNEKHGINTLNNKITVKELATLWLEQHQYNIRESTYKFNVAKLKVIINKLGNYEVKKITLPMVQNFINELSKTYSKGYLNQIKLVLTMVFDYAVRCDLLVKNVVKFTKIPNIKEKEKTKQDFYTKSELIEFLDIVKNNYKLEIYLMFRLLAYTGCRKSEITVLTWRDIDFKNNTISINKTHSHDKNGNICINPTKTKKSNRVIDIDKETMKILKSYKASQVVFNLDTALFNISNLAYLGNKLISIYKKFPHLKKITVHGFRHTHASLLFEMGASVKEVQERLGHSDIKTTMDTYTHLTQDTKQKTAREFENYMAL